MPVNMLGWELLEEFEKGKKTFSGIHMEFSDMTSVNLEGLTIKDSKLNFVLLRMSNLKNCKIDYGYFQDAIFDGTKMTKCNLSFCGMFSASAGSIDMSTSTLFKVFTDVSQVSQDDMDAAYAGLLPFLQN